MTISAYSAILQCATLVARSKIHGYYPIRGNQFTYRGIVAQLVSENKKDEWMDGWMMAREEDDGGRRES